MCCVETKRPSMKDINRYVKKYAANWKDIGLELEIDFDELAIIERDHHSSDCVACFQVMINHWLKVTTDNATWKTLEVALTNVNRQKLKLDPVDDVYGMENRNKNVKHNSDPVTTLSNHLLPKILANLQELNQLIANNEKFSKSVL